MKKLSRMLSYVTAILFGVAIGSMAGKFVYSPFGLTNPERLTPNEIEADFEPFWEVYTYLHTRYYEQPLDETQLVEGAIDGMLATLGDPHTRYLPPADEEAAREDMNGEFEGIGAFVEEVDGNITIVAPIEGSPAEAAGLKPGDILREADGVALTGMAVEEAAALVRGPRGTAVVLLIERDGEQFEKEITRDRITIPSVRGEMLENNIAYVRLSRFGNNSAEEMKAVLEELDANNAAGLILDLRSNPGGALDTAVDIADQFLDEGTILIERFGSGEEISYDSKEEGLAQTVPMVVLIDEGSASASEVLAGAIRDRGRGVLIGQTSFGKGTVQTWIGLSNGGGVRITVARWLTPDHNWVHGEGLVPDYFIPLPETAEDGAELEDTQLQAAIDFLLGKPITSVPPETTKEE